MAGIVRYGAYVPFFRMQRSALGGGRGERAVASYDEDAVSMAVEAGREALRGAPTIHQLIHATVTPAYAEKLDAALVHGALALDDAITAVDCGGSTRAGLSSLLLALDLAAAGRRTLVIASDVMTGAPDSSRERTGGDAACAFVTGNDDESVARLVGRASLTAELLDVWRTPEDRFPRAWEERFGAEVLTPLLREAATRALTDAGLQPGDLTALIVDCTNDRAAASLPKLLGAKPEQVADMLSASVGRAGSAAAGLALANALDRAKPGDRIAVIVGADGADAAIFEVTSRIEGARPRHSVSGWIEARRNDLAYNTWLKWRGILPFEPPRRPDPDRPAAPPMHRADRWKFAFEGSRCTACGVANLPPQRVCVACGAVDRMKSEAYAEARCRIATYTIDRLAYSLQPPVVAAVVDFEQGGRMQCELTDVDPSKVAIGDELEMTFRRLFTAQGVHNYFWKARPLR